MEIFVGNLPFDITEREILDAFAKYGEVSGIKMLKDKQTGRVRGIAFVSMPDDVQANAAIDALNNADLGGRPLRVDRSRERVQRFNGFGGGFRRNGNAGKFANARRRFRKDFESEDAEGGERDEGFRERRKNFRRGRGEGFQKPRGFRERRFDRDGGDYEGDFDSDR